MPMSCVDRDGRHVNLPDARGRRHRDPDAAYKALVERMLWSRPSREIIRIAAQLGLIDEDTLAELGDPGRGQP
jgi:hypothetical protein